MADEQPGNYAESVMIGSLSPDAREDFSLRLARFPGRGVAHVWLHLAVGNEAWSVVDESFLLTGSAATPVADSEVGFSASREDLEITFRSSDRRGEAMVGRVRGTILAAPTRHPVKGSGQTPIEVNLVFNAASDGFRSRSNRWELTGSVSGEVKVDGHTHVINHRDGKWHEQTGPRTHFAPAFTYLNLQNSVLSLLAIGFKEGAVGYALVDDEVVAVESLSIDPVGTKSREFVVKFKDNRVIEGTARVVQDWSVEIEGHRRPGSSVIAETPFGNLLGSLNDWQPEP